MLNLKEYKLEDYFDIAVLSLVAFYPELYKYLWIFFVKFGLGVIASNLHYIVWGTFILAFLPIFSKRVSKIDIAIYVAISVSVSLFSFFPWYNAFTWTRFFDLVTQCLPFFILGRAYRYSDKHEKMIFFLSGITLALSILYTVFFVIADEGLSYDDMFSSYNVLYSILMFLSAFFRNKSYLHRGFAIVGIIYLLLLGTRGPFLCVCVFFIMMLIKKIGSAKMIVFSVIGVLLINIYTASPFYQTSLDSISKTAEEYGFSTRIFDLVQQEDIFNLTGRDNIQNRIFNEIQKNPFEIRGPYSDRIIISRRYNSSAKESEQNSSYAHNFFLEMWTQYGILFGSFLIIFIIISVFKLVIRVDKNKCYIVYAITICGFFMLMFSSSYLLKESFFFLMGLCFNECFIKKKEKLQTFN